MRLIRWTMRHRHNSALTLVVCCSTIGFAFIALFRRFATAQRPVYDSLSASSYGMYLIHYPVVVWLQYALLTVAPDIAPCRFCAKTEHQQHYPGPGLTAEADMMSKFPRCVYQSTGAITGTRRSATTVPQLRTTAPTKAMAPLAIGPSASAARLA